MKPVIEQCKEVSDYLEESHSNNESISQSLSSESMDSEVQIVNFKQNRIRKIKILFTNDDSFQRLVASSSIIQIPIVGKIDEATNGQEALEMVKKSI